MMSEEDDYQRVENIIASEIELYIKHAARAAAQVVIAFERGYRMGG
jgi:hypothetical protein